MRQIALLILLTLVAACRGDETLRAYGAGDRLWHLVELNGVPFTATTTLHFPEPGKFAGRTPCNSYSGMIEVPYPWFETSQVRSTKMVCPELAAEAAFFDSLHNITLSEVAGDTLLLSTPDRLAMVFKSDG